MKALSIILGILMIICGVSCMCTPLATFLSTGHFIAILLLVYGIFGIIRFCRGQSGLWQLIVSILAVIVGLAAVFRPGQSLVFDRMILYFIACWLVIQGIVSIFVSIQTRSVRPGWVWGLIIGIIGVLAGIYSFAHPVLTAVTAGVLIGLYFVESGLNLIIMGVAIGKLKDAFKGDE